MNKPNELEEHYSSLSTGELLQIWSDGGFTDEAEQLLRAEFARRGVSAEEVGQYTLPEWLDEAKIGEVVRITLVDGEQLTAELDTIDDDLRLHLRPLASGGDGANEDAQERILPYQQIKTYAAQEEIQKQWPYCDPCRNPEIHARRILLMFGVFLSATLGSLLLFVMFSGKPYGIQLGTVFSYTMGVLFLTFAHTGNRGGKDLPPYMFTCPAVRSQLARLLLRHVLFLCGALVLETALLSLRTHGVEWPMLKNGDDPLNLITMIAIIGVGYFEMYGNRSILKRAHKEYSAYGGESGK